MENVEITSMSSRGQIVIPQNVRNRMNLKEGEKFIVVEQKNNIILTRFTLPTKDEFLQLLKKTQSHAKKHNLKERDMWNAIEKVRKKQ